MRKRRLTPRSWPGHEAEMADNFRALSNTSSRHLATWTLSAEEDAALAQLPPDLRHYLLTETIEAMRPTEVLHNERLHGNMLHTLTLFNLHLIREHYGPDHPTLTRSLP